jgi:serine/threonine protein kinase
MHENLILHRDLKLNNLLLGHSLEIKVADFGLAVKLNRPEDRLRDTCGTPSCMAPEQFLPGTGHSLEADIWSLGVIVYTLLVGKGPFIGQNPTIKSITKNIKNAEY